MAVHVEDHPLDYFDFEGVIPAGEYGGGDVIVWDWGTWEPAEGDDPLAADRRRRPPLRPARREAAAAGSLLVRRGGGRRPSEQWLLLHKHDDDAVAGWDPEDHPRSVKSGRTNDEVTDGAGGDLVEHERSGPAPTADELAALDALGKAGRVDARRARRCG